MRAAMKKKEKGWADGTPFFQFLVCHSAILLASSYLSLPYSDDPWLSLHCCATHPMRATKRAS